MQYYVRKLKSRPTSVASMMSENLRVIDLRGLRQRW